MKIIDKYVYAVTRNLSRKQRADVEREIRSLIRNMMNEHQGTESDEQKAEKILRGLGDPNILAEKYSNNKGFLIGPQNYYNYTLVIKIVLAAILFAVSLEYALNLIFSTGEINLAKTIGKYFGSLIFAALQGFIWVTAVFVILDYKGISTNKRKRRVGSWDIYDLPEIPQSKAVIRKSESIFSIIFSTVFIMILYFAPQYFGIYILNKDSSYTVIPFFNIEVLNGYKLLLFGLFLTTLIKEILKMIAGRWNLKLGLSVAVLNIVGLFIMLTIFLNTGIFNSSLPSKFISLEFDATLVWNIITKWFVVFINVGYIIDIVAALYKGSKYNY